MHTIQIGTLASFPPTYDDCVWWLTHKIRTLSDDQMAGCRGVGRTIVRQAFRRLERGGLIALSHQIIQTPDNIGHPLYEWWPGVKPFEPNWEAISYKAQSRWKSRPTRALVASATKKAVQFTGGRIGGRTMRPLELNHDLALTQLFLGMLTEQPEVLMQWIPEDALGGGSAGEKRPDAVIRTDTKEIFIELAGKAYSAEKLRAIHTDFARRNMHHRIY